MMGLPYARVGPPPTVTKSPTTPSWGFLLESKMIPRNLEILADYDPTLRLIDWRLRQGVRIGSRVEVLFDGGPGTYRVLDSTLIPGGTAYFGQRESGPDGSPVQLQFDHAHVKSIIFSSEEDTADQVLDPEFRNTAGGLFSVGLTDPTTGWTRVLDAGEFVATCNPALLNPQLLVQLLNTARQI